MKCLRAVWCDDYNIGHFTVRSGYAFSIYIYMYYISINIVSDTHRLGPSLCTWFSIINKLNNIYGTKLNKTTQ